ncbi:TPA: glucosamine-6-phosphate deaminase [Listeria monocytogenes]|nr:glucosamine-6-phosphate deaminase [Listeria monocytogenes]EAF4536169.1 glucosamine-6-phosphate deaminase [Listeria monocytogenes serotype 1/2a]EAF4562663.1 glucosamine-6-phosphate deaminase [Listeria monocytogenes]EBF5188601.1 glucosamine-6-phosphate deaminase [Listeria monocytogenes]HAO5615384.1 glucosamine-6-phosphate deaminase [Listeria monocytogenes]
MKIIVEKDYENMSKTTMQLLLGKMYQDKKVHLAITAGSTPKRMYELMVEEMKEKAPLKNVSYYNFDEIPIGDEKYGVTIANLKAMYFDPAGIPEEQIHMLDKKNYVEHEARLKEVGGLDAILIGIGEDGHFCGNLPGVTKFGDETRLVSVQSRPDMFDILLGEVGGDVEKVPEYYVTMGPKSVMHAKEVILFANGKKKAAIIKKALQGPVTEDIPSSIFQLHPNFTVVLDEEAASELNI